MTIYLKICIRCSASIFRCWSGSCSIYIALSDYQIKHHVRRNDPNISLVQSLLTGCINTGFKIHPLSQIVFIPAALGVPSRVFTHGDLIPNRSLIVLFFFGHAATDCIFIGSHRTIISNFDGIPIPGDFIQTVTQYRSCNIFILRSIQPSYISTVRAIIPNTLRFNLCNILNKRTSQSKFCIQGSGACGEGRYRKRYRRLL